MCPLNFPTVKELSLNGWFIDSVLNQDLEFNIQCPPSYGQLRKLWFCFPSPLVLKFLAYFLFSSFLPGGYMSCFLYVYLKGFRADSGNRKGVNKLRRWGMGSEKMAQSWKIKKVRNKLKITISWFSLVYDEAEKILDSFALHAFQI